MTLTDLVKRADSRMHPDAHRVIVKLFVPGEEDPLVRSRAAALIARIQCLDEAEAAQALEDTLRLFRSRHYHLESVFLHHYDLVQHRLLPTEELSSTGRLLVGAYFSHEYSVESAALCNPSMVADPDQSGLDPGELRVIVSLRQVGEGHISSIGFATAVIGPGSELTLPPRTGALVMGQRHPVPQHRDLLAAGLAEEHRDDAVSATVLGLLPESFTTADLERTLSHLPADLMARPTTHGTIDVLRHTAAESYAVTFPTDVELGQRVLWPSAPSESHGMEDARFVLVTDPDGGTTYQATYTAYDGRAIAGRLLSTRDFIRFEVSPLRGPGAHNKGMALFPRPVGGRELALCRADGETLGLTTKGPDHQWRTPVPLHVPRSAWELIQVGNCGSPLETPAGWLVLTHGVGAMRRYSIGALLLDLDEPERVIAELPGPLLSPDAGEREGYVPNVVYSCGGLIHDGTLWLPYGASDHRIEFGTVQLDALLAAMVPKAQPSPVRATEV